MKIEIVYSTLDVASTNIAKALMSRHGFVESGSIWQLGDIAISEIDSELVRADFLNDKKADLLIMLSKHSSSAGVPSFTTHPLGNWGNRADLGGMPKRLSVAAPIYMCAILKSLAAANVKGIEVTYEATHHGPLLRIPSLFVELGGNADVIKDARLAEIEADAIILALDSVRRGAPGCSKIAIGIGGTHYPEKFARLAIEKGYAFAHIMPKYAITNDDGTENIDMLEQAVAMATDRPGVAVIDWKSINATTRNMIIAKLDQMGMPYERI